MRLAMAQMSVVWGRAEKNLRHAAEMVEQAAARGADIVLLPECLDVGWTHPEAARRAAPVPGPRSERLAEAARANDVWVVAGLT